MGPEVAGLISLGWASRTEDRSTPEKVVGFSSNVDGLGEGGWETSWKDCRGMNRPEIA